MAETASTDRAQQRRPLGRLAIGALVATLALGCSAGVRAQTAVSGTRPAPTAAGPAHASAASGALHHYEYVFPDGSMYVYDMDAGHRLVQHVELPIARGVRGVVASPRTHLLYLSYGGDGGTFGNGSLLAYDLLANRVLWTRSYQTGIDSMAISADGSRIFMPSGENDPSGLWSVLDARNGNVLRSIQAGAGAHDTVVGPIGRNVYLGGRNHDYLEVASVSTGRVFRSIGPLRSGVRPFTVNGHETLAFTTATGFLGFQVSSITSGRVLYTENFPGFAWNPADFSQSAPSHGISLSPDERQAWVIDAPNSYVHVFDVSGLPGRAPRMVANIPMSQPMKGEESPCAYDCARDGWIQHSRDGRFVYVGDSGDVIDARTFKVLVNLPTLRNTRKMLEIDWRGGRPVSTSSRQGMGYVR